MSREPEHHRLAAPEQRRAVLAQGARQGREQLRDVRRDGLHRDDFLAARSGAHDLSPAARRQGDYLAPRHPFRDPRTQRVPIALGVPIHLVDGDDDGLAEGEQGRELAVLCTGQVRIGEIHHRVGA